jgi:hypothetical protein
VAQLLEPLLLGQQDKAIAQTQNRKWRSGSKAQIFSEVFRNRELALLTDLRRAQEFDDRVENRH